MNVLEAAERYKYLQDQIENIGRYAKNTRKVDQVNLRLIEDSRYEFTLIMQRDQMLSLLDSTVNIYQAELDKLAPIIQTANAALRKIIKS